MSKFPLLSTASHASVLNGRWTILRDAGTDCPEFEINTFLHNFLPRVPEIDNARVDCIVRHIKQHTRGYVRRRWTAFPKNPRLSSNSEDTILRGFDKVVATIQKAAEHCVSGLEPKTKYINLFSDLTSGSDPSQQNTTRPSGGFVFLTDRLGYSDVPHWMDIAVAGEFKKYETDRHIYDNVEKALWNMHHTLHDDPRRRFAFTFTIEDVNMRIWFCNRAEIVVSEPFNFVTEIKSLVQFVLAFLYAPEAAMGLDESIRCIWDGRQTTIPQYLITVRSDHSNAVKQYQTIRLISSVGTEAIRGRGTRMWEVKEVKKGKLVGASRMLKDLWIDSDRPREDAVIKKIFHDAKRLENTEDRYTLQQSFLEPIIAGDVWIGNDVDSTIDRRPGAHRPSRFNLIRPPVTYNTDSSASSSTEAISPPTKPFSGEQAKRPITYHSKTHYRIVFAEVCEVLHEMTSLPDILYTLCKVSEVLRLFHKLGWVHRNLSSGNIMLVGDVVKISNLEFCKKMDEVGDDRPRNIRTVTEDFMAVEASLQRYSFRPEAKTERTTGITADEIRRVLTRNKRVIEAIPGTRPTMPKQYPWFYNPLHDMESIYWLLLYFLCNKDVLAIPMDKPRVKVRAVFSFAQESPAERGMRILHHRRFAHELFGNRVRRVEAILSGDLLAEHLRDHPLHPSIASLDGSLLEVQRALVTRYSKVERDPSKIDAACADGLHEEFLANIYAMMAHVESTVHQITVRSLSEAWAALPLAERDWLEDGADQDLVYPRGRAALISTRSKRSHDEIDASDEEDEDEESSKDEEEEASFVRSARMVSRAHGSSSKAPGRTARTRRLSPTNRLAAVARHQLTEIPASTRVLRSTLRKQANSAGQHSQSMSPARAQAKTGGGRQVKARACH